MKPSGRFDITNHAMGGVAALRTGSNGEANVSALLRRSSLLGREFERQADHGSLLTRRSFCSLERFRDLGDRLLAGHGFEDANIVL
jgi:hypothetical protein